MQKKTIHANHTIRTLSWFLTILKAEITKLDHVVLVKVKWKCVVHNIIYKGQLASYVITAIQKVSVCLMSMLDYMKVAS